MLDSAEDEVIWYVPASLLSLLIRYGFIEKTRALIQKGGVSRGIVPMSRENVEEIEVISEIGGTVRHTDEAREIVFVSDKQQGISAVNTDISELTLDTPLASFWDEELAYTQYLLLWFEHVWSQATPAAECV